jgi:Tlde1 domain
MLGTDATFDDVSLDGGRDPRQALLQVVPGAIALALAGCVGMWALHLRQAAAPEPVVARSAPAAAAAPAVEVAANPYGAIVIDPSFVAEMRSAAPPPDALALPKLEPFTPAPSLALAEQEAPPPAPPPEALLTPEAAPLPPAREAPEIADIAPLPPPRPAELAAPARPATPATPTRRWAQRTARTATAAPADNRNLFQRLFGLGGQSGPAVADRAREGRLASAAPDVRGASNTRFGFTAPVAGYDRYTAVYDISARTVYLPDGTRLEAHSGYGARLDDPRYVNERMRGATPPNLYELEPRETSFHGVQALRLTPIGDKPVFGRAGLLAHSYMLGPNGDSNGCVSFKNYEAFLRAYESGEVRKLAVVARL